MRAREAPFIGKGLALLGLGFLNAAAMRTVAVAFEKDAPAFLAFELVDQPGAVPSLFLREAGEKFVHLEAEQTGDARNLLLLEADHAIALATIAATQADETDRLPVFGARRRRCGHGPRLREE